MSVHLYIWDFVSTLWGKYTEIHFKIHKVTSALVLINIQ